MGYKSISHHDFMTESFNRLGSIIIIDEADRSQIKIILPPRPGTAGRGEFGGTAGRVESKGRAPGAETRGSGTAAAWLASWA